MFKYSLYSSLLTNKKTLLSVSKGKCGHAGYQELQVGLISGVWSVHITDGYKTLFYKDYPKTYALKKIINLAWGQIN